MTRQSPLSAIAGAWQEFWFRPEPMYTLGFVRIAFGALVVAWTLSLTPDLYDFFGTDSISHHGDVGLYRWSVFETWASDNVLLIGWIVLLLAAVALMIGWNTRIAAVIVFILVVSFDRRNPSVFNSGDMLVRIESLFIALSPCGAAVSVDQRRRSGQFWSAQVRARWPIRLMQCQLSLIYIATVRVKLAGDQWPNGTAVSYALRLWDIHVLPVPHAITNNELVMNLATWGALVVESAIPVFVWIRRLRPWALGAGVLLHSGIMLTLAVGFFTPAMFVLYVAFIPPETAELIVGKLRRSHQVPEFSSSTR